MEIISTLVFLFCFLSLLFQLSHSKTVVVDGVSEWKNPTVLLGDSVIFKNKYGGYKLYIFQNKRAFDLCNFTQATLLTKPDSTSFTWHPSRPGFFYYTFNNGSLQTCHGQKLAIKVSPPTQPPKSALSPEPSPISAPRPSSGGSVSSSPAFPWPFRPREEVSPSPAPIAIFPATSPSLVPEKGDDIPFINSNPAVPLPTGEVDSATIRPLATSGHGGLVVGFLAVQTALAWVVSLMLL